MLIAQPLPFFLNKHTIQVFTSWYHDKLSLLSIYFYFFILTTNLEATKTEGRERGKGSVAACATLHILQWTILYYLRNYRTTCGWGISYRRSSSYKLRYVQWLNTQAGVSNDLRLRTSGCGAFVVRMTKYNHITSMIPFAIPHRESRERDACWHAD